MTVERHWTYRDKAGSPGLLAMAEPGELGGPAAGRPGGGSPSHIDRHGAARGSTTPGEVIDPSEATGLVRRSFVPLRSAGVIVVGQDLVDHAAVVCRLLLVCVDIPGQGEQGLPQCPATGPCPRGEVLTDGAPEDLPTPA